MPDVHAENVDHNQLSRLQRKGHASGWAEVAELEWGAPGYEQVVMGLAGQGPIDWVIAADCTYIDNVSHVSCRHVFSGFLL